MRAEIFFQSALAICGEVCYTIHRRLGKGTTDCGLEKLVSRQIHNLKIKGSSPLPATKAKRSLKTGCLRQDTTWRLAGNRTDGTANPWSSIALPFLRPANALPRDAQGRSTTNATTPSSSSVAVNLCMSKTSVEFGTDFWYNMPRCRNSRLRQTATETFRPCTYVTVHFSTPTIAKGQGHLKAQDEQNSVG